MPATKAIKLISGKLNSFDLNLGKSTVASVTGGTSFMKKMVKALTLNIKCVTIMLFIFVIDVFFTKNKGDAHDYDYNPVGGDMEAVDSNQTNSDNENVTKVLDELQTVLAVSKDSIPLLKLNIKNLLQKY